MNSLLHVMLQPDNTEAVALYPEQQKIRVKNAEQQLHQVNKIKLEA